RRQPLRDDLHSWRARSCGSQGWEAWADRDTLRYPSAALSRCASNPRQEPFPSDRGFRKSRPRGHPRRRVRRHADSWRFRDPDVGGPDWHDRMGQRGPTDLLFCSFDEGLIPFLAVSHLRRSLEKGRRSMNSEHRAEVAVPLTSRRKFIRAAIATGGAGMLSAELRVLSARGAADTAGQIVLPAATKDATPFKVSVPQSAIDDLKRRLASTR